jgi:hypothetical protein
VSRDFDLAAESANPVERIAEAFCDEKYWWARIAAFHGGSPTLDSLTTGTDGTTTVTMTLRFGIEQLPPPLNRLRGGTLRVVHLESWRSEGDGILTGTITVDAPGTAMSGHGEASISPVGSGSRLSGSGTVDARIPVIGGAIAGFIAGQLAAGIRDIHQFTDTWIATNDRR